VAALGSKILDLARKSKELEGGNRDTWELVQNVDAVRIRWSAGRRAKLGKEVPQGWGGSGEKKRSLSAK